MAEASSASSLPLACGRGGYLRAPDRFEDEARHPPVPVGRVILDVLVTMATNWLGGRGVRRRRRPRRRQAPLLDVGGAHAGPSAWTSSPVRVALAGWS